MKYFFTALQFLTVFPWPYNRKVTAEEIGRSSAFFPLVGFCLGLALLLFNRLLAPYLPSPLLSVALVSVLVLMTRAFHLDGLGDTFDGLGAKGSREDALAAMRDSRTGVFGLLAVLLVVIAKVRAIDFLGEGRAQALLVSPLLGRWAMVILAYRSKAARPGLGQIMAEHVRGKHLLPATLFTLAIVVIFARPIGLWIALGISLFALLSRHYLHRRFGGLTGDMFGAVGELAETLVLAVFASV